MQTQYTTQCEFESVSDDGVLQVGDWHHLKISVKLAAGTSVPDDCSIFYRVIVNKDTWALSNSSGNSFFVSNRLHITLCYTDVDVIYGISKNVWLVKSCF